MITPIASKVQILGKRTHSHAMEIEEEESSEMPKRKKDESKRELV